jgi:ABC-type multidrug transport system fused ATPase/permease subunit
MCWYFLPQLAPQMGWAFIKPFTVVLPPVFIRLLLTWTTKRSRGEDAPAHVALLYVAGMFLAQMASSLCMSQSLIIGRRLCVRAKALIIAEVFTKTLRRKDLAGKALVTGENKPEDANNKDAAKAEEEGPASAGRIQNLVSVDASRIADLFAYIHFFFPEAPLTIGMALALLFKTIGVSAFAAFGTMILLVPAQTLVARFFMKYQNQVLVAADDRLSLTTEIFQAIKVLKFFAWERKFNDMLQKKRERELTALKKRVVVFAAGGIALCKSSS